MPRVPQTPFLGMPHIGFGSNVLPFGSEFSPLPIISSISEDFFQSNNYPHSCTNKTHQPTTTDPPTTTADPDDDRSKIIELLKDILAVEEAKLPATTIASAEPTTPAATSIPTTPP